MENKIIGFFLAREFPTFETTEEEYEIIEKQGNDFTKYIWNESNSLDEKLKGLTPTQYGFDIELILFEFYLNPLPAHIIAYNKKVVDYRKNEKAVGLKIIITNNNFFNKKEGERREFLKEQILSKMDLLVEFIKKRKFDTNMDLLISDLEKALQEF